MNRLAAAIERLADVLTEKGEKESPPFNPPKGKDPKRKPHPACARACEDAGFDRLFDEFWAAYPKSCPRKVGRSKCRARYVALMERAGSPAALHAEILAGLKRWSASQDWVEDDGRFIKAPLVWLNQENWKDSPSPYSPRHAATAAERAAEDRARKAKELSAAMRRSAIAALTEADWALCREAGCRHCVGNRCSRGVALPPDHRLNARPCRPEECPGFAAKGLPSVARSAKEGGAA